MPLATVVASAADCLPLREIERVAVAEETPELAQRLGVERHQLVVARLAEHLGELVGAHRPQLGVGPRAVRAEALGQRPRRREVAGDLPPVCGSVRLRSSGNQPEPKLIASSVSTNVATSRWEPSR